MRIQLLTFLAVTALALPVHAEDKIHHQLKEYDHEVTVSGDCKGSNDVQHAVTSLSAHINLALIQNNYQQEMRTLNCLSGMEVVLDRCGNKMDPTLVSQLRDFIKGVAGQVGGLIQKNDAPLEMNGPVVAIGTRGIGDHVRSQFP